MTREEIIQARLQDGEYIIHNNSVVCAQCLGNCGQCGNTGYVDNVPASMTAIVHDMYKAKPGKLKQSVWAKLKAIFN